MNENVALLAEPAPPEGRKYDELNLAEDALEIRARVLALVRLYDEQEPQSELEQLLVTAENLVESLRTLFGIYREFSLRYLVMLGKLREHWSREKSQNDDIKAKLHELNRQFFRALDAVAEFTLQSMPFEVTEHTANQIEYELLRRSPQSAIQLMFALFEAHLRQRIGAGPDLYGEPLINAAFGQNGCLTYGDVPAEQIGFRNLLAGFYATFRNPRMHRILADDESKALAIVALVDLLMQIVDETQDR